MANGEHNNISWPLALIAIVGILAFAAIIIVPFVVLGR